MASMAVHDLTVEQYDSIDILELHGRTAIWKEINTPSISIAFFCPYELRAGRNQEDKPPEYP